MGFGFVKVGSVTPVPQEGNPMPRIFRLRQEGEGIVAVARRLGAQHGKRKLETSSSSSPSSDEANHGGKDGPGILGVNLRKNKTSDAAAADYVQGVHTLSQYVDYLVINVSSPNTPGLRMLQGRKQLKDLVKKQKFDLLNFALHFRQRFKLLVMKCNGERRVLLHCLLKLLQTCLKKTRGYSSRCSCPPLGWIVSFLFTSFFLYKIISNTTISRPDPINKNPVSAESGGLSLKPLFNLSTNVLKEMYILTRAELAECLERDGFQSVREAVGVDCI
ncbi:Dihydroorotate dehydrogenase domain - like 2 [Theobroma cacao]|nr:Dihydroorotate dehydrogenase domain - like 2 [Theobroma cacao]